MAFQRQRSRSRPGPRALDRSGRARNYDRLSDAHGRVALTAARTVLEVPVPEADSLALLVRRALNPDRVVPDLIGGAVFAHVSILGPLPPPAEIEDSTWAAVAPTCSQTEAFSFTLGELQLFA